MVVNSAINSLVVFMSMKAAHTLIYVLSSISTNCFDNGETGRKTTGLEAEKYCGPVSKIG